jgi:Gamma tubulin complex component C-terminal
MLFKKGKERAAAVARPAVSGEREKERLKALEYLALSIDAPWPLSLVLSPHAMLVYQFYFKHLTLCKARAVLVPWSRCCYRSQSKMRRVRIADLQKKRSWHLC